MLTKAQRSVLDAFQDAASTGAAPPTLRELCSRFGWSSTAAARDHLKALVRKGALRREAGARNYRLADRPAASASVPLVGTVAAGRPILAIEHIERNMAVPAAWVRRSRAFAVRVDGESMTGAGIHDGDIIVARAANDARDGDIVVARKGDEVTVKTLRLSGRRPVLLPENPKFKAIEVDEDTSIDGIVVGLMRDVGTRRGSRGRSWAR